MPDEEAPRLGVVLTFENRKPKGIEKPARRFIAKAKSALRRRMRRNTVISFRGWLFGTRKGYGEECVTNRPVSGNRSSPRFRTAVGCGSMA